MNILVIGNGFDLAHELPTKYTDFLFFCNIILKIIEESHIENLIPKSDEDCIKWINECDKIPLVDVDVLNKLISDENLKGITSRDKNVYKNIFYDYVTPNFFNKDGNQRFVKEIFYLIYNNNWIEYFWKCGLYRKDNWIDFEKEISNVIKSLDNDIKSCGLEANFQGISNEYLNTKYYNLRIVLTYKAIRNKLHHDLNKLIRALEIYLCEYVEKIEIQKKSPDIDGLEIDFILSFNYTHIFLKLYDVSNLSKQEVADPFDYIHGEADAKNTIETNNMVLGIDEYLSEDRRNKDVEFIAFKKFYQRIYKQTGSEYKEWVDNIKKEYEEFLQIKTAREKRNIVAECQQHNLYIFGHSLDITDKDILRELILNDNVHTTIFYHDKDTMGQQIANLVKVIGQDELIRRTGGSTKTIEFKQQQPMIPIKK